MISKNLLHLFKLEVGGKLINQENMEKLKLRLKSKLRLKTKYLDLNLDLKLNLDLDLVLGIPLLT